MSHFASTRLISLPMSWSVRKLMSRISARPAPSDGRRNRSRKTKLSADPSQGPGPGVRYRMPLGKHFDQLVAPGAGGQFFIRPQVARGMEVHLGKPSHLRST